MCSILPIQVVKKITMEDMEAGARMKAPLLNANQASNRNSVGIYNSITAIEPPRHKDTKSWRVIVRADYVVGRRVATLRVPLLRRGSPTE